VTDLGIVLLMVGGPLCVFGLFRISSTKHVSAKNYSVAIGRDNNAPINLSPKDPAVHSSYDVFWKFWTLITGIATLIGFAIQLWGGR
jgi:hypothetical protein